MPTLVLFTETYDTFTGKKENCNSTFYIAGKSVGDTHKTEQCELICKHLFYDVDLETQNV